MSRRYPWRFYFRYLALQIFLFNFLAIFLTFRLSEASNFNRELFNQFLLSFFVLSVFIAAFTSWRFTSPIWRIGRKILKLTAKKAMPVEMSDEANLYEVGDTEFFEVDQGLERLRRKLKKRKDQLEKEREETQAFMSSVQEGLVSFSLEEKLLYFNSQFASSFLEPSQMQNANLFLTDVFRSPEIYEAFQAVKRTGFPKKVTVRMNSRIEGGGRYFSVSMNALRSGHSREIYGVIGVFHDITDIKKAEQIRIEFVGNASHELRTPLTSIKGYMETLKSDFRSGQLAQIPSFLDIISRNVDRLIEIVNDLLSLSSFDHGSQLRIETIHPLAVTDQVVKQLAVLANEKNIVIKVMGDVPPFPADLLKVEQVLVNLLSNAIKYASDGKSVQIRWEKNSNGDIVLRVIDDGPGIPEEHHGRLFERFYRIDKGRTRDAGGTGLGLAIVKHIMQSHGGSVSVKSQLGQGSEFICVFPPKAVSTHVSL